MALPVFQAGTSLTNASSAGATFTVPAGVAIGDIILAHVYMESSAVVTPPAGFAEFAGSPVTTASTWTHVYWKRAAAADTGTYAFTFTATFREGACGRYSGVIGAGTPIEGGIVGAIGNGFATPAVSFTTGGTDRLIVWSGSNFVGGAWTPPSGFIERSDNAAAFSTATLALPAAGSTGSVIGTCGGSNETAGILLALMPAVVSAPQLKLVDRAVKRRRHR